MATIVYIDGFNLYYGALKGRPGKWLDLVAFSQALLPKADIRAVRYFTARVSARPGDPDQPARQDAYLRAIAQSPLVSVHEGHFLSKTEWARFANPAPRGPAGADVVRIEEKGSDVNLATYLIVDAFKGRYDQALVITNDSDFAEAIRVIRAELGVSVVVANPNNLRRPSRQLSLVADYIKGVRPGIILANQLPDPVYDKDGQAIHKPTRW
jgi:hypothetical protein